jgi:hypothetical protein
MQEESFLAHSTQIIGEHGVLQIRSTKAYKDLGTDSGLLPQISRNPSERPMKFKTFVRLVPNDKYSCLRSQSARFMCCSSG